MLERKMNAKDLRWVFLLIAMALLVWSYIPDQPTIGASAEWINGDYHFAGGTNPWAVLLAALIVGLYLLLQFSQVDGPGQPLPGVFRRFVAFWLDFILAFMAMAPILGIVPTLMEWRRTGEFAWNFERDTPAPYDWWVSGILVLVMFAGLAFYNAWPIIRRRPSPGTCIMGYQIVADEGVQLTLAKAMLRTLLGFIAVCSAYLAPFIFRDRKNGKFWLDRVFGTRAIKLG